MRIFHLIFKRVGPINITDVDFADDIALLSEDIRSATELFHRVESAAANIGLFIRQYPRRPTQSETVPLFVEQFHNLSMSSS